MEEEEEAAACDGGCIGGIIGGCFVPVLMCILWLSGAFAPKCPSPLKPKPVVTKTVEQKTDTKEVEAASAT